MLVPVYQSEIATKKIRGRLVSLQQWAITIGIASTNIYFLGSSAAWRIPLALQIVPALILAIGILFFPFSSRWLMTQNHDNEALATISAILFIDKLGRRFILISGAILMALSMLIMGGTMGIYGYTYFNETIGTIEVIISNRQASYIIISFVYIYIYIHNDLIQIYRF
ncbi:unnamed protein product [Rotaria sp. Silwood1]|nr:unnamed protein product [Rotaria sp. Silwood1]